MVVRGDDAVFGRTAPSAADPATWPAVMTTDVAAALVGVHEQTLRGWLRDGRIRGRRTGRRWHVLRDELIADMTAMAAVEPDRPPAL